MFVGRVGVLLGAAQTALIFQSKYKHGEIELIALASSIWLS